MSIQERKENEAARLRQKIVTAALRVFAEEGYDKVSMRRIAARIDYSATTIYRFFKNKEELLQTIARGTYGELGAAFARVKAESGTDPLDTLKALMREYMIFCVEHADMFRLFSDIASFTWQDGAMYECLGQERRMVYQSWFSCIERAIAAGRFIHGDVLRIFLYLWDAGNGYITQRIRHPGLPRKPLAEDTAEYLELLFHGVVERPLRQDKQGG